MKVREIYNKFSLTPNLIEHLLTVAKVVMVIKSYWTGVKIDWRLSVEIALMHDLGNIVKFDFKKYPEFLGEEINNIDYWRAQQKNIIEIYGNDDHIATKKMLKEISFRSDGIELILNKSFGNSVKIANSLNWYEKILSYADSRVLPSGLGTLDERIQDVKVRMPKYSNRDDFSQLIDAIERIERQIQKEVSISLQDIKKEVIYICSDELLDIEISKEISKIG